MNVTHHYAGTFGGSVQNANHALAQFVANLHQQNGSVAIPGFYEYAFLKTGISVYKFFHLIKSQSLTETTEVDISLMKNVHRTALLQWFDSRVSTADQSKIWPERGHWNIGNMCLACQMMSMQIMYNASCIFPKLPTGLTRHIELCPLYKYKYSLPVALRFTKACELML